MERRPGDSYPQKEMVEVLILDALECALPWNGVCADVISSR